MPPKSSRRRPIAFRRLVTAALIGVVSLTSLAGSFGCDSKPEVEQNPATDPKTPPPYAGKETGGAATQTPPPAGTGGRR